MTIFNNFYSAKTVRRMAKAAVACIVALVAVVAINAPAEAAQDPARQVAVASAGASAFGYLDLEAESGKVLYDADESPYEITTERGDDMETTIGDQAVPMAGSVYDRRDTAAANGPMPTYDADIYDADTSSYVVTADRPDEPAAY